MCVHVRVHSCVTQDPLVHAEASRSQGRVLATGGSHVTHPGLVHAASLERDHLGCILQVSTASAKPQLTAVKRIRCKIYQFTHTELQIELQSSVGATSTLPWQHQLQERKTSSGSRPPPAWCGVYVHVHVHVQPRASLARPCSQSPRTTRGSRGRHTCETSIGHETTAVPREHPAYQDDRCYMYRETIRSPCSS